MVGKELQQSERKRFEPRTFCIRLKSVSISPSSPSVCEISQNISNSNEIEIGDVAKSEATHQSDSERAANLEELVLGYPDPDPDQQDQISSSAEAIDEQTNQAETMHTKDDQEDSCDSQTESFTEVAEQESEKQMLQNPAEKLPCQHCDKSFDNSQSHILHVKQNHTLCNCKICGATIAGMNNLNYHEVSALLYRVLNH